jgi:hypothetical protein
MDLTGLRESISKTFSKDELRILAHDLDIDYDDLGGETKTNKVLELIAFMQRRNQLPTLVKRLRELRPDISWDDSPIVQPPEPSEPVVPTEMKNRARADILAEISRNLQEQRLALFVGADLPEKVTGLPDRQRLANTLAARHGITPGECLAAVAQQVMSAGNRFLFTDFLRQMLDTTGKQPQPFHEAIVALVGQYKMETLITTAYDDLLETAFQQVGIQLNRVVTEADLAFARRGVPTLIKLYGEWRQVTSLTVTEQDHNALLRGREKEAVVAEVRRVFSRNALLFLGQDLGDPMLKALIDDVAGGRFQLPAYAIRVGLAESEIASLKSNRGLTVLAADPLAVLAHYTAHKSLSSG